VDIKLFLEIAEALISRLKRGRSKYAPSIESIEKKIRQFLASRNVTGRVVHKPTFELFDQIRAASLWALAQRLGAPLDKSRAG
jgi:hypothetical protein